jgi:hypothetical protein
MLARLTPAALIVLCLLAAGCGGDSRRADAIRAYFGDVNALQARMAQPLVEVSKANQAFARGKSDLSKLQPRLARSEQTFRTMRRKLEAIDPPPEAKAMQALLVELVDRQAGLAHETRLLATFIPAFGAALGPIGPAGTRLRAALGGKGTVAEKAGALELYGAEVTRVLQRLEPLRPPPSSAPVFTAQVTTLGRVRASVAALASALRERRNADVGRLLHRFDVAAVGSRTLAAQRAQIAAVRSYNGRIRALDALAVRIARERVKLQTLTR